MPKSRRKLIWKSATKWKKVSMTRSTKMKMKMRMKRRRRKTWLLLHWKRTMERRVQQEDHHHHHHQLLNIIIITPKSHCHQHLHHLPHPHHYPLNHLYLFYLLLLLTQLLTPPSRHLHTLLPLYLILQRNHPLLSLLATMTWSLSFAKSRALPAPYHPVHLRMSFFATLPAPVCHCRGGVIRPSVRTTLQTVRTLRMRRFSMLEEVGKRLVFSTFLTLFFFRTISMSFKHVPLPGRPMRSQ